MKRLPKIFRTTGPGASLSAPQTQRFERSAIEKLSSFFKRGNTTVEVLIAVVVVTTVLAGAFTISQKSTAAARDSQERGEMLQILQGQVEMVRALALEATDENSGVFRTGLAENAYFCVHQTTRQRIDFPSNTLPALEADEFQPTVYHTGCTSLKSRYNVAITYNKTTSVFTFTGRWDGANGSKNQEVVAYRLKAGSPAARASCLQNQPHNTDPTREASSRMTRCDETTD